MLCSSSYNIVIFVFPVDATCPNQPEPVDFIISVATFIVHIFALLQSHYSVWAIGWMSRELWLISSKDKICICMFSKASRPPLIVVECTSQECSRQIMKLNPQSLASAKVTVEWSCTFTPQFSVMHAQGLNFILSQHSIFGRTVLFCLSSTLIYINCCTITN